MPLTPQEIFQQYVHAGAITRNPAALAALFTEDGTLHTTADPDTFIAEIDTGFASGAEMSLVQIFRVRDGRISHLRDYFAQ